MAPLALFTTVTPAVPKKNQTGARYDVLVGTLKLRQATGTLTPQDLDPINQLLAP